MVLVVMKWDIHPDRVDAYVKWTEGAIKRTVGAPGVIEFRAYRPVTGGSQVVVTYEFADLVSWTAWYTNEDMQKVLDELRTVTLNATTEIWGPSPVVPAPIRTGR